MKIALFGYGKMGQLIEQLALAQGHAITAHYSQNQPYAKENREGLEQADVAIDFSQPSAVLSNVETCLTKNKPLIIGTTGWDADFLPVQQKIKAGSIGCLYAPNFSLGVYVFKQLVTQAARLLEPLQDYEVGGFEAHHRHKKDRPSGTANMLREQVLQNMPRLTNLEFASVRCGNIPGTHTLYFDSPADTISLTHQARTREGFAQGALVAAQWILGRTGFFNLDDMMENL